MEEKDVCDFCGNVPQLDLGGDDCINGSQGAPYMPCVGLVDNDVLLAVSRRAAVAKRDTHLWQHPHAAGLHVETAVVDPQDEIGAFAVATLEALNM